MRFAPRYPVLIAGWFLVVLSAFQVSSAFAAEQNVFEAVNFAIPDVWPWAYEGDGGQPQGSLIEVVQRLSEITGIPVIPRLRPQRRAIVELRTGAVNFSMLFQNPERDTDVVKVPVHVVDQALDMLSLGRISAILASDHNLFRTLSSRKQSRDTLRFSEHVPGLNGTLYMSRAASRPEAARRFSAAIEQMQADGEIHRIFYGKATSAYKPAALLFAQ